MNKLLGTAILCLFGLLGLSFSCVIAEELYYPKGGSAINNPQPFAGETLYPEGEPYTSRYGVNFYLYNDGSGKLNLNLGLVPAQKLQVSPPVVSPDFNHIVYTEVYNYGDANQFVSRCFYIPVVMPREQDGQQLTIEDYLSSYKVRASQQNSYEILSVGSSAFNRNIFRTLTIVDWSYDSSRALVKEHIGRMGKGINGTVIWVYDVEHDSVFRNDTVRKAIVNYWMANKSLDLNQYVWDIEVLGWEKDSNNNFIVNAYLYPVKGKHKFLGCWKCDIRGNTTQILSLDDENYEIGRYGLIPESY